MRVVDLANAVARWGTRTPTGGKKSACSDCGREAKELTTAQVVGGIHDHNGTP